MTDMLSKLPFFECYEFSGLLGTLVINVISFHKVINKNIMQLFLNTVLAVVGCNEFF